MGFFKSLFSAFDSTASDAQAKESKVDAPAQPKTAFTDTEALGKAIKKDIKKALIPGVSYLGIEFWSDDEVCLSVLNNPGFLQSLRSALDDWSFGDLAKSEIKIRRGSPDPTAQTIELADGKISFRAIPVGASGIQEDQVLTAAISIVNGFGTLTSAPVQLSSEQKTPYHIGRGIFSPATGIYRRNTISIKDDETDPVQKERNEHVSRAHADIIFHSGHFCLRALPGGCRAEDGASTKVVRRENAIELRDTYTYFPLEDGDLIELGKNVLLQFSLVKKSTTGDNIN